MWAWSRKERPRKNARKELWADEVGQEKELKNSRGTSHMSSEEESKAEVLQSGSWEEEDEGANKSSGQGEGERKIPESKERKWDK